MVILKIHYSLYYKVFCSNEYDDMSGEDNIRDEKRRYDMRGEDMI